MSRRTERIAEQLREKAESYEVAGVTEVVDAGGAQAIAAVAYGTESIARVDKVVGPGNIYVACAKRLVFGVVDIDSFAGPSEHIRWRSCSRAHRRTRSMLRSNGSSRHFLERRSPRKRCATMGTASLSMTWKRQVEPRPRWPPST